MSDQFLLPMNTPFAHALSAFRAMMLPRRIRSSDHCLRVWHRRCSSDPHRLNRSTEGHSKAHSQYTTLGSAFRRLLAVSGLRPNLTMVSFGATPHQKCGIKGRISLTPGAKMQPIKCHRSSNTDMYVYHVAATTRGIFFKATPMVSAELCKHSMHL